ncbi:MAG: enoyl-[acyl-carrier protein] reductase [Actinomycetota bacterium]|nr:enoyl-[acyl-carrier protein] reductase [Actinomycetota bacterium]
MTPAAPGPASGRPVALVTGSSRGIGRATALLFAERGYDVAVHYRREGEAAEAVAKEARAAGAEALVVQGDLQDGEVPGRLLAEVGDRFGRLDVLVANAASTAFKPLTDVTARHLDLTMRTVVQSFLLLSQGAVPLMAGRPGAIVAVSGFDSLRVVANHGLLGAAKAALEQLVRYLAVELGPKDIAVNSVLPGFVATDSARLWAETSHPGGWEAFEAERGSTPGSIVGPEEIAGIIAFLCSPAGRCIRGHNLIADGGVTLPFV